MDIFGTVASAINLTNQICNYLRAVKGADDDRHDLLREITELRALLNLLCDPANESGLVQTDIQPALKEYCSALQLIASKLNPGSGRFDRVLKKLEWPFRRDEIQETLNKIERLKSFISLSLHMSLKKSVEAFRDTIEPKLSRLEKRQTDHIDEKQLQEITGWLSQLDFDQKQNNIISTYTPDSGNWLLKEPTFQSWVRGEFNTLWCPGNAGVGKTVITSVVINYLQEHFQSDNTVAVTFLFLDYKAHGGVSALQLLEALFKQLTRRHMMRKSLEALEDLKTKGMRPKSDQFLKLLKAEINTYSTVVIAVDALDELPRKTRDQLLADLRTLSHNIRLIATSRKPFHIPDRLRNNSDKYLEIVAYADSMRLYVEGRISEGILGELLENDKPLRDELISTVVKKADGMFLLVRLHMDSLETKLSRKALRKALNELPKELRTTYDEAMKRISASDKEVAYKIFSWLVRAKRPLTLADLQYALAVEEGMTEVNDDDLPSGSILSRCAGLVVLQHDDTIPTSQHQGNKHTIGLVHYTTQEYFLNNHDVTSMLPPPAHLAVTCLRYLHFDIFKEPITNLDDRRTMRDIPFMYYAASHWGDHAREHLDDTNVPGLITRFLQDGQRVETAGVLKVRATGNTALQLCAIFGLEDHFATLLSEGADVNAKDSDGDTALTNAAIYGRDPILRLLVARDDTDLNPRGWHGTTPLYRAARQGYESTVKIILEISEVDVNAKGVDGWTPLSVAAARGHEGVVKLLLEKDGVDIESKDVNGCAPLALAAIYGRERVVKLLLEKQIVDIESKDTKGWTPLALAASCGHEGVVRILAMKNADVQSKDVHGSSPLALAAQYGYEAIVKLLVEELNADIESKNLAGCSPLAVAAGCGQAGVVQLLLLKGADVNVTAINGKTPLALAAEFGHEEVVNLLLETNGVDIHLKDAGSRIPLAWAAGYGHKGVVKLFMETQGVDIDSRDADGYTPFALAAESGHEEVVKLLLENQSVDIESKDVNGCTPLALAALSGREGVVKLLLERKGVDIEPKATNGYTPLALATINAHEGVVRMLVTKGANVESKDEQGSSPLAFAAQYGYEAITKLFLEEQNAKINAKNLAGYAPLALAAGYGQAAVVRLLLLNGADVNTTVDSGKTPLALAAEFGHEEVVKLLLEKDVDIESKDVNNCTPLALAALYGHDGVVKLLLERKFVDIESKDLNGCTSTMRPRRHSHPIVGEGRLI